MIYAPHCRVIVRLSFKVACRVVIGSFLRKCGPKLDTSVEEGWRTTVKVMSFENARCTCDTDAINLNASSVTKKVDIRGEPASMITVERNSSQSTAERTGTRRSIIQFPQMVGRFVVPTDYDGQDRGGGLARMIPLKKVNFWPLRDERRLTCGSRPCACTFGGRPLIEGHGCRVWPGNRHRSGGDLL
jgi:hypothetical protein